MIQPRQGARRAVLGTIVLSVLLSGVLVLAEVGGAEPQRGRSRGWSNTGPAPDVDYENMAYDGRFTFARVRFNPTSWGGGRYAWGLDLKWNHDYPRADRRLAEILDAVTGVEAHQDGSNIVELGAPELFRYPWAYMCEVGFMELTDAEAAILKRKPIELNYKKLDETAGLGPYFRMILGEEMKKWCKENKKSNGDNYNLYRDGLKIYTTINPRMQQYAEEAVAKHMNYMQKLFNTQANIRNGSIWKGYENVLETAMKQSDRWKNLDREGLSTEDIKKTFFEKTPMRVFAYNSNRETDTTMTPYDSIRYHRQMLQAGFMVMDPLTGEIKAWVGGIGFKSFKYDHVNFNTKRQVGSTMKPLLYSLAIEEAGFTPNTTVYDEQQSFGQYGLVPATSRSCQGGAMPMASALAFSRNCASAYIMKQLDSEGNNGAKRLVDFLERCDFKTKIEPYPSIALGSCEISLFEMMQGFSMFPGRGFNVKPMYITRIEDRNGNVLATFTPKRKEVISEVTAYSVVKMMQGTVQVGTGRGIWGYGMPGVENAGKTGTTNENSDGWFMGYTPQLMGGAWVGADDRFIHFNKESANGQCGRAAMPIWAYFFAKAAADPNCGIDKSATFVKPDVMSNDIVIDYLNDSTPILGGEGEDVGTGNSQDYEIPQNIKLEDIGAESDIKPASPKTPEKKDTKGNTPPPPAEKPKAVLPKKPGGGK